MNARQLFFVNRFYWPEEPATALLLTDLAEALAQRGYDVTVITSHNGRPELAEREERNGVTIVRIRSSRRGLGSLVGRFADFATFSRGALRAATELSTAGDTLVFLTDPPMLGTWAVRSRALAGRAIIQWAQDVYPEIVSAVTGFGLLTPLKIFRNQAWRRSQACVALGQDMARLLRGNGVAPERVHVIPNWGPSGVRAMPANASPLRKAWELEGKFIVAYSGNLGRVHDLAPVLTVAERLRAESDLVFVFIGGGAQRQSLEQLAARLRLANVRFHPAQPRELLSEALAVADVHLVTLRSGCEQLVFPSKLYGIAAAARPVLYLGPECEIGRLVRENRFGASFTSEQLSEAAQTLLDWKRDRPSLTTLGQNAHTFSQQFGRLELAVESWDRLLQTLAPTNSSVRPLSSP